MDNIMEKTGIYMAYPTTSTLKSIYRAKNYKTKVNDEHTKVGKTEDRSFKKRSNEYCRTFDKEVKFIPLAVITDSDELDDAESRILDDLKRHFLTVGHAREWFNSNDHQRIKDIVKESLSTNKIKTDDEWKEYEPIDCS